MRSFRAAPRRLRVKRPRVATKRIEYSRTSYSLIARWYATRHWPNWGEDQGRLFAPRHIVTTANRPTTSSLSEPRTRAEVHSHRFRPEIHVSPYRNGINILARAIGYAMYQSSVIHRSSGVDARVAKFWFYINLANPVEFEGPLENLQVYRYTNYPSYLMLQESLIVAVFLNIESCVRKDLFHTII